MTAPAPEIMDIPCKYNSPHFSSMHKYIIIIISCQRIYLLTKELASTRNKLY
jgi:hypothetical protein